MIANQADSNFKLPSYSLGGENSSFSFLVIIQICVSIHILSPYIAQNDIVLLSVIQFSNSLDLTSVRAFPLILLSIHCILFLLLIRRSENTTINGIIVLT